MQEAGGGAALGTTEDGCGCCAWPALQACRPLGPDGEPCAPGWASHLHVRMARQPSAMWGRCTQKSCLRLELFHLLQPQEECAAWLLSPAWEPLRPGAGGCPLTPSTPEVPQVSATKTSSVVSRRHLLAAAPSHLRQQRAPAPPGGSHHRAAQVTFPF